MWVDVREFYLAAWRFARICPWLGRRPALPARAPLAADVQLGM